MATNVQPVLLSSGQKSIHRYEDLLRAITAIAGYRDIATFRERFASELRRFISFDYVIVNIINSATHVVEWRMLDAPGRNHEVTVQFEADETPTAWVYENQKPVIIDDWDYETRYPRLREFFRNFGVRSTCVLPLSTVHRRIGVFATGTSQPGAYSAEEVEFLSVVADHLALAIDSALNIEASQNARSELERKNERLELVLELTNRVVSNLELRDLLREVAAHVRRVMK
jgi:formate hydrogenlyase transcriptional activator